MGGRQLSAVCTQRVRLPLASPLSLFLGTQFSASAFSFVFFILQLRLSTLNFSSPNNPFPFTHLILFLDKYRTRMVIWYLIVSHHSRRSALHPTTLLSFHPHHSCPSKSHRIISFADPHPLTLLDSYRSKKGGGVSELLRSSAFSAFFCFRLASFASLPRYFKSSERLIYVHRTKHRPAMPISELPRPALSHADRYNSPPSQRRTPPHALRLSRRSSQSECPSRRPRSPRRRASH